MSGPLRWPVHPAPTDGEALSSWLRRIADCYGTDIEHLGDDIGYKLGTGDFDDIDLALRLAIRGGSKSFMSVPAVRRACEPPAERNTRPGK